MPRVVRKSPRVDEPRRVRIADEERRDREVQLVGEAGGEELRVDRAAAFHHQPADVAFAQVVEDFPQVRTRSEADHLGEAAQAFLQFRSGVVRGVDELLAAVVPEPESWIKVPAGGEGDLERVRREVPCLASGPALGGVDQQPRIVPPQRGGADQDRVAPGPYLVYTVEVAHTGQPQSLWAGVIDIAVERGGDTQNDVGTHTTGPHGRLLT